MTTIGIAEGMAESAGNGRDVIVLSGVSVLGRWLEQLVGELGGRAGRTVRHGAGDDVLPDLGEAGGRILLTPWLTRRHIDLVGADKAALLAAIDDPIDSVRFFRIDHDCPTSAAIKEQTRIAATSDLLRDRPGATILPRGFGGTARDAVRLVAAALRIPLGVQGVEEVVDAFAGPAAPAWTLEDALRARGTHYLELSRLNEAISGEEAALVRQTVSPLLLAALSAGPITVVWSHKVMFHGDRPNEPAPPVAEVTGGARIIYYGPYFHLLPGLWECRFVSAFSPELSGVPFKLEIYCVHDLIAKATFKPAEGGAFEGAFSFRHGYPERPIEVHFSNDEGTIDGHVALGQLSFTRTG